MLMQTFGSVCTGIGGFDLGFERAGMECLWTCEIDEKCNQVLDKHFPHAKRYRDMLSIRSELERVNVFCGGTPCQGFSIAGLRGGLEDERSNLALEFVRIADHIAPDIIVWENVPGVLSDGKNAFGCFLGAIVGSDTPLVPSRECGGRWTNSGMVTGPKRSAAWRVFDSQYHGLAQRRERVFLVADTGNGCSAKILFEPESMRRNSAPCRQEGEGFTHDTAGSLTASGRGVERTGETRGQDPVIAESFIPEVANTLKNEHDGGMRIGDDTMLVTPSHQVAPCLQERDSKGQDSKGQDSKGQDSNCDKAIIIESIGFDGAQDPVSSEGQAGSCVTNPSAMCVAFAQNQIGDVYTSDIVGTLSTNQNASGRGTGKVLQSYRVRRLTPNECARLSGFPDDWNDFLKDSPRYAQFGNCVNVPVAEWIGRRIIRYGA